MDVNPVVSAVRVCPYCAVPEMVTVPLKLGAVVEKESIGLAGEAKCVAVSANRCEKKYAVNGDNPVNSGEDW